MSIYMRGRCFTGYIIITQIRYIKFTKNNKISFKAGCKISYRIRYNYSLNSKSIQLKVQKNRK